MNQFRKHFPFYKIHPDTIYFDNAATSLTPYSVIDSINNYYINYSNSPERSEFKNSIMANEIIDESYKTLLKFINCDNINEIHFTANATDSINIVARSLLNYIKKDDVIIISKIEHSSNMAPWIILAKKTKAKIKWLETDENQIITLNNLKKIYSKKVKLVAINTVSNVIGKINEYEAIGLFLSRRNTLYMLDATQSAPHIPINIKSNYADFLVFSFHKMYGPTGIGALYINSNIVNQLDTANIGGGIIHTITDNGEIILKSSSHKFFAGTKNYAGIFGAKASMDFMNNISYKVIMQYENELIEYFNQKIKNYKNICWYNSTPNVPIFCINVKNHFCQDVAQELDKNNICVRVGDNCAKLLKFKNKEDKYIRLSLSFYNTKKEIDKVFDILNSKTDFLDSFFSE